MAGSLASATNTRVDSASKHIIPCKVNTDYMASLVGSNVDNSMRELQTNKMKYCMHKDDVVIGLGRPMFGSSINSSRKKAYPSVIVTLAGMDDLARKWIALHNFLVQTYDGADVYRDAYFDVLKNSKGSGGLGRTDYDLKRVEEQIRNMLDFYFVGISLGLAYAHPHSGDTVASVMVGGLRTVLNGDFQVHTNDLLMFYWPDERDLFEENGGRKDRAIICQDKSANPDDEKLAQFINGTLNVGTFKVGTSAMERKDYHGMQQGTYKSGPDGAHRGKTNVAMIKPYIVSKYPDPIDPTRVQHFPMDKCRIFGKAISNAQRFEMLDVMLSRQAI